MNSGSARLVRLLNMVPYFQANPRVSHAKAAADLGVSGKQLRADVDQLFMCGLPGYGPGDLIDFAHSDDYIEVTFSAGMDRPLRLTSTEATGLLMALSALADIPGVLNPAAARSAIAKIEAAAGTASLSAGGADDADTAENTAAAAARQAAHEQRALEIEYFSASRDAQTKRIVDPIRVVLVGDQSYLEAWCRDAEGVRLFRFDRIIRARVLDEPAAAPQPEAPTNTALFDADPSLPSARLRISPRAAWMLEYYPMRVVSELPDGSCEAEMTYAAEEWVARQILGLGTDVQVLAPQSLAVSVRKAANDALSAYTELGG
jgi:proteasome accessory factor C